MPEHKLPDVLTHDEQTALLRIFNPRYHGGRRNRLIVELMLTAGLRVSEVCNLQWSHLRKRDSVVMVRQGKGRKDRNLPVPNSLMAQLHVYRDEAETPESPYVFATRTGNRADRSNLNKMVKKYAAKAGIEKRVYNHLLRHSALTDLYRRTRDIRLVQQAAGHASIQMTQVYTHISAEDLREAMAVEKY